MAGRALERARIPVARHPYCRLPWAVAQVNLRHRHRHLHQGVAKQRQLHAQAVVFHLLGDLAPQIFLQIAPLFAIGVVALVDFLNLLPVIRRQPV
jgi:hypothetical protein